MGNPDEITCKNISKIQKVIFQISLDSEDGLRSSKRVRTTGERTQGKRTIVPSVVHSILCLECPSKVLFRRDELTAINFLAINPFSLLCYS